MPIQPVKIPQNVYIEDRIVGPLTLRQIIIVAIGGGFSYVLWAWISKAYGVVSLPITVMVWLPCVVSIAFAFVKVNDLSMMRLCLLFMERINKPPRRTWAPRRGITVNIRTFNAPVAAKSKGNKTVQAESKLAELSTILDARNAHAAETNEEEPTESLRPVRRSDVTANPSEGTPLDGIAGERPSISIFHDIKPPSSAQ